MKYYKELMKLKIFTYDDALKIVGNAVRTSATLYRLLKNNYISRIRRDLYTSIDPLVDSVYINKYLIGSKINENSIISYHSAFEYYGCYNQVYSEVQVSSTSKFKNFTYEHENYKYYATDTLEGINYIDGIKVTSLERCIVDSIKMGDKVMDFNELIECLNLITYVDENMILKMLSIYKSDILYKKVGYILHFYKDSLNLSDEFFKVCKRNCKTSNIGYFSIKKKSLLIFDKYWGLYVYQNTKDLVEGDKDISDYSNTSKSK